MLTINIKRVVDALSNAPVFTPPAINSGVKYIQEKISDRLASGKEVRLSEIDFSAFVLEDIDEIQEFHRNMMQHEYDCEKVANSFCKLKPTVVSGTFV
jgi:GTP1/Obg family GTP-binding protein